MPASRPAVMRGRRFLSPLLCRYNGFMLGATVSMCEYPFVRRRFSALRHRAQEFLDEVGLDHRLPADQQTYIGQMGAFVPWLLDAARERSTHLGDFVQLGMGLVVYVMARDSLPDAAAEVLTDRLYPLLEKHSLSREELDRSLARVPALPDNPTIDEVLSPLLRFLTHAVRKARVEPRTCFVAMPFRRPYRDRYGSFYTPLLLHLEYRPLRAWGGIANEDYHELLLALLAKSGMVLADISGLNHNVVYEIGAAHALGKRVILLQDTPRQRVPANAGNVRWPYDSRPSHRDEALTKAAAGIAFLMFTQDTADEKEEEEDR